MLLRLRTFVAQNFVASIVLAVCWFAWQLVVWLNETDPTRMRVNPVPLGAAFLIVIQVALLALYRKRGELTPLVRVFAGLLGIVQLLQSVVVAWIASSVYGQPFPTGAQMVFWYLCASNLAFALIGPPPQGARRGVQTD